MHLIFIEWFRPALYIQILSLRCFWGGPCQLGLLLYIYPTMYYLDAAVICLLYNLSFIVVANFLHTMFVTCCHYGHKPMNEFSYMLCNYYVANMGADPQSKYAGVSTDTPAYFQITRVVSLV